MSDDTRQAIDGLPEVQPPGPSNRALLEQVHPSDWAAPTPAGRYNLVVLGGGTAGLVAAAGAAGLGARVALVERHLLGGDCLVTGCVPSKALLRSARAAADARRAAALGVRTGDVEVDFPAVMERMRARRAELARHDSAARFRDLGVDVFLGEGRFTSPDTLEVGGRTLRFSRAVVATGARAALPPIPGIEDAGVLTHQGLFSLEVLPPRLAVVGGGPIGVEMAQAFARFGSQVTLLEAGPRLLGQDDPAASAAVLEALRADGVDVRLGCRVEAVRRSDADGPRTVQVSGEDGGAEVEADEVLVAAGRAPNVEGIGLEAAGVRYDRREGVEVDDRLRTSNRRVFAAGDVASRHRFTHAADFLSRVVLRNALFLGRARASDLVIPRATYTDPEVAQVGLTADEASRRGLPHGVIEVALEDVDRAVLDGETAGFVKVVHDPRGRVLGATVVAAHAGEMIGELVSAVQRRAGLAELSAVIHPYPTVADAVRRAGDLFNRTRLTPGRARLLRWFLARRR